jgi:hypothetical protein
MGGCIKAGRLCVVQAGTEQGYLLVTLAERQKFLLMSATTISAEAELGARLGRPFEVVTAHLTRDSPS